MTEKRVAKSSIYEKIENKGLLDAQEIIRIGEEKAKTLEESIINNANKEIDSLKSKSLERSKDRIRTKATEFEQAAKQKSLLKKKELIHEVFENVHQKLMELDDKSFSHLIIMMLKQDDIIGNEIIKVSEVEYQRYVKVFSTGSKVDGYYVLDKIARMLNDKKYQLRLSENFVDIDGGFIVVGEKFDIDHSYETMLANLKEKNESEIAQMLFEGE